MKKIVALAAFVVLGVTATYAQTTPAPAKKATPTVNTAPAANTVATPTTAVAVTEEVSKTNGAVKKESKKECTTEEKKACDSKAGKKSCCSHKE